jgi:beta-glucosidase
MQVDEATLRQKFLPPYRAAVDAGSKSVMVSFSSWNGVKMHAQKKLITDLLKGELGFKGFVVSDWAGINQVSTNYDEAIVTSINAGLDMIMVPDNYPVFIDGLTRAVQTGRVPQSRIDDAVRRILTVKFELGLFEHPLATGDAESTIGSPAHRQLAREAVRKSLVLLKNEGKTLPISKDTPIIFVAGTAADDRGVQSGGWTLAWQGTTGNVMPGTTILSGIQETVGKAQVLYDANGNLPVGRVADVGIVVVGERPYAEGVGDREDLSISDADSALIDRVKAHSQKVVVVLVSGRPMVVTTPLMKVDAFVAAWLPGTEGRGVADVLFGDYDFTGRLPYAWPRWNSQLPFSNLGAVAPRTCAAPLAPFGFGLTLRDESPPPLDCPKP